MDRVTTEQKYYLEDGRKAEKRVTDDGMTRVTEVYEESDRPQKLSRRVTEKLKPVVCERTVETLDEYGAVIDSVTKTIRPPSLKKAESYLTKEDISALISETASVVIEIIRAENRPTVSGLGVESQYGIDPIERPIKKNKIIDWALGLVIVGEMAVLIYLMWPTIQSAL